MRSPPSSYLRLLKTLLVNTAMIQWRFALRCLASKAGSDDRTAARTSSSFSKPFRGIIFSEMRKWANRSKVPLPVEVLASRALVKGYGEEWSATGMSTSGEVERLEGFHAEGGVLLICDETKGIPQAAFDALLGTLTGHDNRLMVTSPVRAFLSHLHA